MTEENNKNDGLESANEENIDAQATELENQADAEANTSTDMEANTITKINNKAIRNISPVDRLI